MLFHIKLAEHLHPPLTVPDDKVFDINVQSVRQNAGVPELNADADDAFVVPEH